MGCDLDKNAQSLSVYRVVAADLENISTLSGTATLEYKTLDVTAEARDDLADGRPCSQFRLRFNTEDGTDAGVASFQRDDRC